MASKTVGLVKGRYYPVDIINSLSTKFHYFTSLDDALLAIGNNEVEVVLENPWIAEPVRERLRLTSLQHGNVFNPHYITYRFQMDDNVPHLVEAFNVVISNMLLDGSYKKYSVIPQKLFSSKVKPTLAKLVLLAKRIS